MNLIDLLRRSSKINISAAGDKPKKMLVMKLIDGPIKKEIILHPEQMPITFGRSSANSHNNRSDQINNN